MKLIRVTFAVLALAAVGGCVAVPVSPGYYAGAPGYYGPSIGIGIYGGGRGYGHGYGHR